MNDELIVSVEDIETYDIETVDGPIPTLTLEDLKANADFLINLGKHCAGLASPCRCSEELTGENLVSSFKFTAILEMSSERYTRVIAIVKECKTCHRLEYFGDSSTMAQLMAEATVNRMNTENDRSFTSDADLAAILGSDVVFENIGDEKTSCDCHCKNSEE